MKSTHDSRVNTLRDLRGGFDIMVTVDHHLRLNNRAEAVSLADSRIASKTPRLLLNQQVRGFASLYINPKGSLI